MCTFTPVNVCFCLSLFYSLLPTPHYFQSSLLSFWLISPSCSLSYTYVPFISSSLIPSVHSFSLSFFHFHLSSRLRPSPIQPQLLERLLEEIHHLKATVSSQEKRICDLENKLSQYTNGTD